MTRERGEELANMFKDNYELAKKMGADNAKLALVVALLYTLDDMNQCDGCDDIFDGVLRGLKRGGKLPLEGMDVDIKEEQ